jgi:hypothetical protein
MALTGTALPCIYEYIKTEREKERGVSCTDVVNC